MTYTDALSSDAADRLKLQYGTGVKRYGAVASWGTMIRAFFYDLQGTSIAESLYRSNHPAQLHYGIWDTKSIRNFDAAIRRATDLAHLGLIPTGNDRLRNIIHFGSGFGGVDIQLCLADPKLYTVGVSIEPTQIGISRELARLYNVSDQAEFLEANFLSLPKKMNNAFDAGLALESLCHIPEKQLGILWKSIFSVLQQGARFVVQDWYRDDSTKLLELTDFLKGWDLPDCVSVKTMTHAAAEHGFRVVRTTDYTDAITRSSWEIFVRSRIFMPFIRLMQGVRSPYLQSLGVTQPEALAMAKTCVLQRDLFTSRKLRYWQLVFEKVKR